MAVTWGLEGLVPIDNTDVELSREFSTVQNWAQTNEMIINMAKTKELVFI